jgi:hypothetical protein
MLTIDFANGNPLPANGVSFSGGNELLIAGSVVGGLAFAINATQVTDTAAASSPINYSGVQTVMFNLSGGSNTLTQQSQLQASLVYNAGAGGNTLNVNGGSYSFNADPQMTSGNLTVNDNSSVIFAAASAGGGYASRNLYALNLTGAATATVTASTTATDRIILVINQLSIVGGSTLDIGNNAVIVHNGDLAAITSQVQTGHTGGLWAGTGITSSLAAADSTHLTAIGVIPNSAGGTPLYSTFDGVAVASTDVLLKDTYYGDANLDGKVDGSDYSRIDNAALSQGGSTPLTGWFNGDFNYDGVIDGSDYTLIDNLYNIQQGVLPTSQIATPAQKVMAGSTLIEAENEPIAGAIPALKSPAKPATKHVTSDDRTARFVSQSQVPASSNANSFSIGGTIRLRSMRLANKSSVGSRVIGELVTSSAVAKPDADIFSDMEI